MQVLVCNGYNLLVLEDDSPEGFERVYRKDETDEKIEQYKHTLEHYVKEIKLLTAEIDKKDEEKEWLIDTFAKHMSESLGFKTVLNYKGDIIDNLQKAQKEK